MSLTGQSVRLGTLTFLWTLFQWWAVIGWPGTAEEAHAALVLTIVASVVGLTGWYGLQRVLRRGVR